MAPIAVLLFNEFATRDTSDSCSWINLSKFRSASKRRVRRWFHDIGAVVGCLPGASLRAPPDNGALQLLDGDQARSDHRQFCRGGREVAGSTTRRAAGPSVALPPTKKARRASRAAWHSHAHRLSCPSRRRHPPTSYPGHRLCDGWNAGAIFARRHRARSGAAADRHVCVESATKARSLATAGSNHGRGDCRGYVAA